MDANKIVDYVKRTPGNTNPAVIKSMVSGVEPEPVEVGSFEVKSDFPFSIFYVYDENGELTALYDTYAKDLIHTIYFPKSENYQIIMSIDAASSPLIDGIETYSHNQTSDLIWFVPEEDIQVIITENVVN